MKLTVGRTLLLCLGTLALVGCGDSTPVSPSTVAAGTPSPAPSPTPAPTPTPAPAPTPSPCTQGLCEEPTTNTAQPVRLTLRVYYIVDPGGKVTKLTEQNDIPVGYEVHLDATAKDANNKDTNGSSNVLFSFDNESIVEIGGTHPFQRKVIARYPGIVNVTTELDGVKSNNIRLRFK